MMILAILIWGANAASLTTPGVKELLAQVSVSVDTLAHAGATGSAVSQLLEDAGEFQAAQSSALRTIQDDLAASNAQLASLRSRIQRGLATSGEMGELNTLRQSHEALYAEHTVLLASLRLTVEDAIGEAAAGRLETIVGARGVGHSVPTPYKASERSDQEWLRLRRALHAVRIASDLECAVDPQWTNLILQCDAEGSVAHARIDNNFRRAEVELAWDHQSPE